MNQWQGIPNMSHGETIATPPLLVSKDEQLVDDDPQFRSLCVKNIARLIASAKWTLGSSVMTRSERWGLLLRIDFHTEGADVPGTINRMVFWRAAPYVVNKEIAFGQQVPALPGFSP